MTKEELAVKLDGCHYGLSDVSEELIEEARKSGLVIGYGSLNTLIQFEGATYYDDEDDEDEEELEEENEMMYVEDESPNQIKAFWKGMCQGEKGGNSEYFWSYETSFPVAHFRMIGRRKRINDEKYCEGIVFNLEDLQSKNFDMEGSMKYI